MSLFSHIIVKMYLTRLYKSITIYILFIRTIYIIAYATDKGNINLTYNQINRENEELWINS